MTTLHDVARHAGVSIATVSRVLRGTQVTTPATRERVLASVKHLGYAPNPIGQALKAGQLKSVALLMGDIEQGWYAALARDMQLALEGEGLDLLLFNLGHSEERLKVVLERALSMRLSGVAIATSDKFPMDLLSTTLGRLRDAEIPVAAVGRQLDEYGISSISHDDARASRDAVAHLVGIGRVPISYMSRISKSATGRVRFDGYLRGLAEHGIEHDPNLVWDITESYRFKAGYETMTRAIRRGLKARAVIAGSDELALGSIAAARDCGLSVPEELAIVGFGGLEWGEFVRPGLTTLDASTAALGQAFCEFLRKPLEQQQSVLIPRTLKIRESA